MCIRDRSWADEVLDLAMPRKWHAAEARPRKLPDADLLSDELLRRDQHLLDASARNLEPFLKPDQSERTTVALSRLRVLLAEQSPLQFAIPLRKGKWLRRERKRLGLGGKKTALRLGITEYRLRTLEVQNEVVPTAWLSVLAELDFRGTSGGTDSLSGSVLDVYKRQLWEERGDRFRGGCRWIWDCESGDLGSVGDVPLGTVQPRQSRDFAGS